MADYRLINLDGGVVEASDSNQPGSVVVQGSDGSIDIGLAEVDGIKNTGKTIESSAPTLTTNGTVLVDCSVQYLDATAGAFIATLQPASTSAGVKLTLIKIDGSGNIPTIKGSGTDAIIHNGTSANTYALLTTQGAVVQLWCDGTNWYGGKLA